MLVGILEYLKKNVQCLLNLFILDDAPKQIYYNSGYLR